MRAPNRVTSDPRLRAVAGLLACLLAISLSTATHAQAHKHAHRGVVAAALAVTDSPTGHLRADQPVAAATLPAAAVLARGVARSADSSGSVSPSTVRAPQVRGPPLEAAA